jgi:type 1 glutamine amidotransferase
MTRILVLSGTNHNFAPSAALIHDFLAAEPGLEVTLSDDPEILASPSLAEMDACIFGSGFTRAEQQADGSLKRLPNLTPSQEDGLLGFVAGGKGLVGIHGTGWWIGGRAVDLLGGHSNWHPPGLKFTVQIDDPAHPATRGIDNFEVDDEIYISAYDPAIHILASAEWHGRAHPMAWTKSYGQGRVFYTTLGHGPQTFARPSMQRLIVQGTVWAAQG